MAGYGSKISLFSELTDSSESDKEGEEEEEEVGSCVSSTPHSRAVKIPTCEQDVEVICVLWSPN